MSGARGLTALAGAAILLATPPARAGAQTADVAAGVRALADRVRRVGTGTVRLHYAVRPGVCGDGADGVTIRDATGATRVGRWTQHGWGPRACEPGPARVTIAVDGGVARVLQLAVGGSERTLTDSEGALAGMVADVHDLGDVAGAVAAAYLVDVAAHTEGEPADRAVLAAAVAGNTVIWPDLLRLARNGDASPAARRAATFWTGQFACDAVRVHTPRPNGADTADRDVRKQVVFALSQRASDERTPALTRVARADRDPEVRCSALFWLGQTASGPARVALDLYDDVLRAR